MNASRIQLAGVGLVGAAKARFNEIATELAALSTTFGNNILDATKAFALTLTSKEQVSGLLASGCEKVRDAFGDCGLAIGTLRV